MMLLLRQWLCGLRGHDDLDCFTPRRWCRRCVSCGRETPGFLFGLPPVVTRSKVVRFRQRLKDQRLGIRRA